MKPNIPVIKIEPPVKAYSSLRVAIGHLTPLEYGITILFLILGICFLYLTRFSLSLGTIPAAIYLATRVRNHAAKKLIYEQRENDQFFWGGADADGYAEPKTLTALCFGIPELYTSSYPQKSEEVYSKITTYCIRLSYGVCLESSGVQPGGYINGGGFLAWGGPRCRDAEGRENNDERAIRAALKIVGGIKALVFNNFIPAGHMRIGIASGEGLPFEQPVDPRLKEWVGHKQQSIMGYPLSLAKNLQRECEELGLDILVATTPERAAELYAKGLTVLPIGRVSSIDQGPAAAYAVIEQPISTELYAIYTGAMAAFQAEDYASALAGFNKIRSEIPELEHVIHSHANRSYNLQRKRPESGTEGHTH